MTKTKDLEYYMNHPDIITEPNLTLRESYAIKLMIHELNEGLTMEERWARMDRDREKSNAEHGYIEVYQEPNELHTIGGYRLVRINQGEAQCS
ncbi:MAG: hypothetical protein LBN97_10145 [Oscillospiraceae bacterium]|jgi:hypothetical protein|nr:hypothetical protein [Oscillospiraceae bacterium]